MITQKYQGKCYYTRKKESSQMWLRILTKEKSPWIIQIGPKPNHKCLYKREIRHTQKRRQCDHKAQTGVMWPQERNAQSVAQSQQSQEANS